MNDEQIERQLQHEGLKLSTTNIRAIAFMIDDMIISIIFAIIFWDKFKTLVDPSALVLFINSLFLYILAVKTIYQTIFIAMYGQTLGKMVMKIRVINREYFDEPSYMESLQRGVVRALSEVVFYLGFIWANFTPLKQTWHDKYAKTLVVNV